MRKLLIHISKAMASIKVASKPYTAKITTATDPLMAQSNKAKTGTKDAIAYMIKTAEAISI